MGFSAPASFNTYTGTPEKTRLPWKHQLNSPTKLQTFKVGGDLKVLPPTPSDINRVTQRENTSDKKSSGIITENLIRFGRLNSRQMAMERHFSIAYEF